MKLDVKKPKAVLDIVDLLKTFLPHNLYAMDFSADNYKKLLEKLDIVNSEDLFELKKGTIIEGIIEYFNLSFQTISIELSFHKCVITKHFTDESCSESLDRMLHQNSKHLLEIAKNKQNYRVLPYLLSIPKETRNLLLQGFITKNEKLDKARKLLRLQIAPIFNMSERDITFFLRGRIWIRYYTPPKKITQGAEKRYAGESQQELDAMYQNYFPNGMWEDILSVLSEIIDEKLNFSVINNETFSKTFIPVFRGMIEVLLIDVIRPEEREKIEGFTGYILRKYFDKILLFTAKNLLKFVENRDKNAEIFIKYFSDDIVIDANGNKIQKNPIVDFKEQKWKYVPILSILMQYKQAKTRILTQNSIIDGAQEQVRQSEEDLGFEKNNKLEQENKLEALDKLISKSDSIAFRNKVNNDPKAIAAQIKNHENLLNSKKIEKNALDLINIRIANKNIELTRRQKKLEHEIKAKEIINQQIKPLRETYEGIAHGVAVVLTKR